jgi:hypothetical protein
MLELANRSLALHSKSARHVHWSHVIIALRQWQRLLLAHGMTESAILSITPVPILARNTSYSSSPGESLLHSLSVMVLISMVRLMARVRVRMLLTRLERRTPAILSRMRKSAVPSGAFQSKGARFPSLVVLILVIMLLITVMMMHLLVVIVIHRNGHFSKVLKQKSVAILTNYTFNL